MTATLGPDTAIADLVRSLQREGVDVEVVPAGDDKRDSLRLFGEALRFPHWYGHNLDALFDCLLTYVHEAPAPVHVIWDGTANLRAEHPDAYAGIVQVLDDVESERPTFAATVVER
jgi:RNAse (barnase) inhibitor barstar